MGLSCIGIGMVVYIFLPMLSYQVFDAPIFAAQKIVSPLPPDTTSVLGDAVQLPDSSGSSSSDWFPHYIAERASQLKVKPRVKIDYYTMSIPKLKIDHALVSTIDNDIDLHLVNFGGTAVPPDNGNAVVFGHSTLPWLFDQKNYKTIFANAHKLAVDDEIIATVAGIDYTYKIYSITVVDPDDLSMFEQKTDTSYLTIVTCTPPGTILYRLIIRARLEKL